MRVADRGQDLEPALPRERQVEQHERVIAGQRRGLPARAVVADRHGVPVGMQALLDEACERPLVFDDQDPHLNPLYALLQAKPGLVRRF